MQYSIKELKITARHRAEYREHTIGNFRSIGGGVLRAKCRTCDAPIDLAHDATSDTGISGYAVDFTCPKYRPWPKRQWPTA